MNRTQFFTHFSSAFLVTFFISQCFSQGVAIGQWRDHLPYYSGQSLAIAGDKVYYVSQNGMFEYNQETQEITRMSKITGLSDIGYSRIKYDKDNQCLVIAYNNSNIDLIKPEGIVNVNDIARKNIPGDKSINHIFIKDGFAYLSCGFGIVLLDLKKNEIKDTYILGPNGNGIVINAVAINDTKIFAATQGGLYEANLSGTNLSDYSNWTLVPQFAATPFQGVAFYNNTLYVGKKFNNSETDTLYVLPSTNILEARSFPFFRFVGLDVTNGKLIIVSNGSAYIYEGDSQIENLYTYGGTNFMAPSEIEVSNKGVYWVADKENGLMQVKNNWDFSFIPLNGPRNAICAKQDAYDGSVYVAGGAVTASWSNTFSRNGIYAFADQSWNNLSCGLPSPNDSLFDIIDVYADRNTPGKLYAASNGRGVVEYENGTFKTLYNGDNSSLQSFGSYWNVNASGITGDADGNIWVTNSNCTNPLSVRRTNGTWKSFYLGFSLQGANLGDLIVDDFGTKWIILPRSGGLAAFTENGTFDKSTDDKYKKFSTSIGNGNIPSTEVFAVAKDKEGEVWVGSDKGIFVFYSPGDIFSSSPSDAQQILVTQNGIAQYLLESETVSAIAVDGANRKWIGTQKAGVFLMSADGTEQIEHFTTEDSPLFSNEIVSISIDEKTGEVFIATGKGIISYRGDATEGVEEINKSQVLAYPNPVRPGYEGKIAVKGLTANADIKITDASGELVFSTTAFGGQAIWDGTTIQGSRAKSGIYLVFSSDEKGKQTVVTKILMMN